jgi:segregation and condensation protein B
MTEQVGEPQEPLDTAAQPSAETAPDATSPPSKSIDELVAALGEDGPADAGEDAGDTSGGDAAAASAPEEVALVEKLPMEPDDDLSGVEGEASARLVSIVESLLFAANRPLTVRVLRKALSSEPSKRQIQLALKQLEVDTADKGVVLRQVAGGFVLRTNPDNASFVQRLLQARPVRLSRPQLETLAVIVYRQPITRAEIDHVRGVDSGAVLKLLLERDLIKIVGRKEEPGRPMLYGTTVKFLEFFELKNLRDLPDLHEFRELSDVSKDRLRTSMDEDELEVFGQEVIDFARAGGEDQSDAETTDEEPAVTTQEDAETTDEETASPTQEVVEDTAEDTAEDAVEDAPADEGEPSATPGEESPS